jgi:transcriptional regulator with XRE-family HTH domain
MNRRIKFGVLIKELRIANELPLREVASILEIDTSTLSKIEKGERNANKQMVKTLSTFFNQSYEDMLVIYLSDKVAYELVSESCSSKVLKVAEEKINLIRTIKE